jgi:hypothetical protein
MTQPTTIRTQRPIEICIKRFQSLTPRRLFRPNSDELIIQASEIVKRYPDETRYNLAVIFHRTGWRKIPICANLEANGFVNSDYAGTLIHYQIKNTRLQNALRKYFCLAGGH